MSKESSWSASTKHEVDDSDLSLLAGKWRSGIEVKVTNPARIRRGPVKIVVSGNKERKKKNTPLISK